MNGGEAPVKQSFYAAYKRRKNRDLRDEIRGQDDASSILDLVLERGQSWDTISISTALHTMACKAKAQHGDSFGASLLQDRRWTVMREIVQRKLVKSEARNYANNAWALATLSCADWPLLDQLAAGILETAVELRPQELANSCWAFAVVKLKDKGFFEALIPEVLVKVPLGVAQDITNTMWAFATAMIQNQTAFETLGACAATSTKDFKPQELANAAWALATTLFQDDRFVQAACSRALATLPEFRTQNLANFMWAYAKLAYTDEEVIAGFEAEALKKMHLFAPQDLSTVVWAFSTALHRSDDFFRLCMAALSSRQTAAPFVPQHASNTLWSLATVHFHDEKIFNDILVRAQPQLWAFKAQELSNIVWACASVLHSGTPSFVECIAQEMLRRIPEFDPQSLGNAAWALTMLKTTVTSLYEMIWLRLGESAVLMHCSEKVFSMLVVAFLKSGYRDLAWQLFDRVVSNRVTVGVAALGLWLHDCRHLHLDLVRDVRVMVQLAKSRQCRHLATAIIVALGLRLVDAKCSLDAGEVLAQLEAQGAASDFLDLLRTALTRAATLDGGHAVGGSQCSGLHQGHVPLHLDWQLPVLRHSGRQWCDYDKECQVLRYALSHATQDDPESVIRSIEQFSWGSGAWLKIAGDEKGAVLDEMILTLPRAPPRVVVEFGCYVGYSCTRMSRLLQKSGGRFVSVEVDPVHVCLARNMVELAGLSRIVDIYAGYSEDAIPELPRVLNGQQADVVFMDQRGTRFHIDLHALEDQNLLSPGCVVAADNVLKPGAPQFLWYLQESLSYSLTVVSVREFAAERVEDWMSVAYLDRRDTLGKDSRQERKDLDKLAFLTDKARQKSCNDKPGAVGEEEWARHSEDLRGEYFIAGIRPRLVKVLRDKDGTAYVNWTGNGYDEG